MLKGNLWTVTEYKCAVVLWRQPVQIRARHRDPGSLQEDETNG